MFLSYCTPTCSPWLTWKGISLEVSAELPVLQPQWQLEVESQVHNPCSKFISPSSFIPGCIRLKEKFRHAQLGHHPKRVHLAYIYPERGTGCWGGNFSTFLPFFISEKQRFFTDFSADAYGTSPTQLGGTSHDSGIRDGLTGLCQAMIL